MIRIERLSKYFRKLAALKEVSVSFEKGQSIAILGPNASGKTTLIKSILGMVRPSKGKIFFQEKDISKQRDYLSQIGYMPQIGRYPDHMRVGQVFELMKSLRSSIDQPELDEELIHAFELPAIFHKPMYTLSGGTRQKVSAALAFLFNPQVLILDEPTAGLDVVATVILKKKMKAAVEQGKLLLITSHLLNDLEGTITHILYLREGEQKLFMTCEDLIELTGIERLPKAIESILNQPNSCEKSSNISYSIS